MAGFLVAALCLPDAFDESALLFPGAYAVVRFAQVLLLALVGQGGAALRRSVLTGLLGSTTVGVGLYSPPRSLTARFRAFSGRWPSCSTWPDPCCLAPRGGGSSRATSLSATA